MTRWTDAKAYRPDLYASLAAVTLPDSGKPSRGTASKATDLTWAMPTARAADASHSSLLRVSTIGGIAIAFAINALLWATIVVCFALIVSGSL